MPELALEVGVFPKPPPEEKPKIEPKLGKFVADRSQADEKARIVALFKEYTDRGKVPSTMIAPFVKELFKPFEKNIPKAEVEHLLRD